MKSEQTKVKKPLSIEENLETLIKISCTHPERGWNHPETGCISKFETTPNFLPLSLLTWDEDGNLEVQ